MLFRTTFFVLKRMLRGYIGLVFLMALPLAIITVNGFAVGDQIIDDTGRRGIEVISVAIVLCFQLVGGFYSMEFIKGDLFSSAKWRLQSLPLGLHVHAYSILISSTLYSALNGLVMVLFTHWVYGVDWGNMGWTVLVLFLLAFFSQTVFMVAVLGIKKYKFAELLGYVYVFSFMILSGYFFIPVPGWGAVDFINTYMNPVLLGETAVVEMMAGGDLNEAFFSAGLLLAGSVLLGLLAVFLGRRRLA